MSDQYVRGDGTPGTRPTPVSSERSEPVLEWLQQRFPKRANPNVWRLLEERTALGVQRYGTPLMSFNGRPALDDALDETVDAIQYLAQAVMETGSPVLLGLLFRQIAIAEELEDHKHHV